MKTTHQRAFLLILTIFVVILSLFNTGAVFADDGTPPVEPVATEVSVVTDVPSVIEDVSSERVDQTVSDPDIVSEVLEQIPEDVQIIVLDEGGEVLPLATQNAAVIISENDPMWCPAGQTPGGAGCTASYATVTALIANLGSKSGAGTIYFTSNYSINDAVFDQTNANLASLTDLTIQGGWNGLVGVSYVLSGSTTFNGVPLSISNWSNSVTINNVIVDGATSDGISVETLEDIVLNDVQSSYNDGDRADLSTFFGNGNITLTGTNIFNNNHGSQGYGLIGDSSRNISLSNIIANNNTSDGAILFATRNIFLSNSTANNNDGSGVTVAGSGTFTLTGVNNMNNNGMNGLEIFTDGSVFLNNVTANNNIGVGALLRNDFGTGNVTVAGLNTFNGNNGGLVIWSNGQIALNNITTSNNNYDGLTIYSNSNVTIYNIVGNENGNAGIQLRSYQQGNIVITCGKFQNNKYGVDSYVFDTLTLNGVIVNGNTWNDFMYYGTGTQI